MAQQLPGDDSKPEHLQAAVANLVRESRQDPSSLFRCEADLDGPHWTPAKVRAALAAAAKGKTRALQCGWVTPSIMYAPDPRSGWYMHYEYWERVLIEIARAGSVSLLQAFLQAHPKKFAFLARQQSFLGIVVRCGPGSRVLRWLERAADRGSDGICLHGLTAAAAREGCLDSLQWLRRPASHCGWDAVRCSALVSKTHAWQRLRSSSARHIQAMHGSAALCTLAAAMGDTGMLRKLRSTIPPCPWDEGTIIMLAQLGQTAALANLLPPSLATTPPEQLKMMYAAAKAAAAQNQLATLSWIWEHHAPSADSPPSVIPLCYMDGGMSARFVHLQGDQGRAAGISLTSYTNPDVAHWAIGVSKTALDMGQVRILEWLWDRCPQAFWQQQACHYVAWSSRYQSLRWLLARYPPCHWEPAVLYSSEVLSTIRHHTHLPSPGLLDRIVGSMSIHSCNAAATYGNLELLRYLRSKQCPWHVDTCLMLGAHIGNLCMLQWICKQEPSYICDATLSNVIAQCTRPELLQWLLQHQPAWPLPTKPEGASARCLALLVQWKCPLTPAAQARAKTLGPLSPSLVIGLARWHRRCLGMGSEAQRAEAASFGDRRGQLLLSQLSNLPEDLIMHICCLAGMCKPLPG